MQRGCHLPGRPGCAWALVKPCAFHGFWRTHELRLQRQPPLPRIRSWSCPAACIECPLLSCGAADSLQRGHWKRTKLQEEKGGRQDKHEISWALSGALHNRSSSWHVSTCLLKYLSRPDARPTWEGRVKRREASEQGGNRRRKSRSGRVGVAARIAHGDSVLLAGPQVCLRHVREPRARRFYGLLQVQ